MEEIEKKAVVKKTTVKKTTAKKKAPTKKAPTKKAPDPTNSGVSWSKIDPARHRDAPWQELRTNLKAHTHLSYELGALTVWRGPWGSGKSRALDSARLLISGGLQGLRSGKSVTQWTSCGASLVVELRGGELSASFDARANSGLPRVQMSSVLSDRLGTMNPIPHDAYREVLGYGPDRLRRALAQVFNVGDELPRPAQITADFDALWSQAVLRARQQTEADGEPVSMETVLKAADGMRSTASTEATYALREVESLENEMAASATSNDTADGLQKMLDLAREVDRYQTIKSALQQGTTSASVQQLRTTAEQATQKAQELQEAMAASKKRVDEATSAVVDAQATLRVLEQEGSSKDTQRIVTMISRLEVLLHVGRSRPENCLVCDSTTEETRYNAQQQKWRDKLLELRAAQRSASAPNPKKVEAQKQMELAREAQAQAQLAHSHIVNDIARLQQQAKMASLQADELQAKIAQAEARVNEAPLAVQNYDGPSVSEILDRMKLHRDQEAVRSLLDARRAHASRQSDAHEHLLKFHRLLKAAALQESDSAFDKAQDAINAHLPEGLRLVLQLQGNSISFAVQVNQSAPRSLHTLCGTEMAMITTAVVLAFATYGRKEGQITPVILDDAELAMMDHQAAQWTINHLIQLINEGTVTQAFVAWPSSWTIDPPACATVHTLTASPIDLPTA